MKKYIRKYFKLLIILFWKIRKKPFSYGYGLARQEKIISILKKNKSKRPDVEDVEAEYIKECTYDSNPNREKLNKDLVSGVKVIYTRKTKSNKQCKKEFYATQ